VSTRHRLRLAVPRWHTTRLFLVRDQISAMIGWCMNVLLRIVVFDRQRQFSNSGAKIAKTLGSALSVDREVFDLIFFCDKGNAVIKVIRGIAAWAASTVLGSGRT